LNLENNKFASKHKFIIKLKKELARGFNLSTQEGQTIGNAGS
jgi:hypothetical protein